LRRRRPDAGHDAAREDGLALAPPLELHERAVGAPPQLVADRAERMLGDVEPEALPLPPQQLGLPELAVRDRGVVPRRGGGRIAEIEDRGLTEQPVLL